MQYSDNSMMICGYYKAIVLDVDSMAQLKVININTVDDSTKFNDLLSAHMIPDTGYKFMHGAR